MAATSFLNWYANLPLPWLVAGPNGQLEAATWPAVLDSQVAILKQAAKVAFPDYTPTDGLVHVGGDRQLYQGATETNQSFTTRCLNSWSDWARAGTPVELLAQLYFTLGIKNAFIVQQNGLYYTLSSNPTAGQDPTALLTIGNLSTLGTQLNSNVTPPTAVATGRSITAGNSWWSFDSNTDFSSRFAILIPSGSAGPFTTWATATFTGVADNVAVTWNNGNTFPDLSYKILPSAPTVTDNKGNVLTWVDGTTKTTSGVTVRSSDPTWTGSVDLIAYPAGANPFANLSANNLSMLQKIIKTWRNGEATCMGVYVLVQGKFWGWPIRTWGSGGTWGASNVVSFPGA